MMGTTVGALIEFLKDNFEQDETIIAYLLNKEDYEGACEGSPIPWEQGAHIISSDGGMDWLTPEIYNAMAQIIGEEEKR